MFVPWKSKLFTRRCLWQYFWLQLISSVLCVSPKTEDEREKVFPQRVWKFAFSKHSVESEKPFSDFSSGNCFSVYFSFHFHCRLLDSFPWVSRSGWVKLCGILCGREKQRKVGKNISIFDLLLASFQSSPVLVYMQIAMSIRFLLAGILTSLVEGCCCCGGKRKVCCSANRKYYRNLWSGVLKKNFV